MSQSRLIFIRKNQGKWPQSVQDSGTRPVPSPIPVQRSFFGVELSFFPSRAAVLMSFWLSTCVGHLQTYICVMRCPDETACFSMCFLTRTSCFACVTRGFVQRSVDVASCVFRRTPSAPDGKNKSSTHYVCCLMGASSSYVCLVQS